jgi:D-inositol-3-phosphate glycosyltransferase
MARRRFGIAPRTIVLMFADRVQPLRAPDVLLRGSSAGARDPPRARRPAEVVRSWAGRATGRNDPDALTELALGARHPRNIRLEPPCPQRDLADWYRAATLVVVPSYSSPSAWCRWSRPADPPVVAAAAGGLRTAVRTACHAGSTATTRRTTRAPSRADRQLELAGQAGPRCQEARVRFGWASTVDNAAVYGDAMSEVAATVDA